MKFRKENQIPKLRCSMTHAFKLFWVHYVDFAGKSTRSEYWWWRLWSFIISLGIFIFTVMSSGASIIHIVQEYYMPTGDISDQPFLKLIIQLISVCLVMATWRLATFIPNWALEVRRLHDTGMTLEVSIFILVMTAMFSCVASMNDIFLIIAFALNIFEFVCDLLPKNTFNKNKQRNVK